LNWNAVTAVFGGTFDPPHRGHREAVRGLFAHPGVRRVLVVPAGTPPFKPGATSNDHRLAMTKFTFQGLADVEIDRREIDRTGTSYAIDTVLELKREHANLAFVIGTDQLEALPRWHRFRELLTACHWIVLARKPDGEQAAQKILREWEASGLLKNGATSPTTFLKLVQTDAPELASADIRAEIARESDPEKLVTRLNNWLLPDALAYLMEHRIYGMPHRR
jgi:nicotinate-nucleotide adenylyltransferase